MGQCDHFTHVWVSCYETQVFRRLTVVNGTPGIWGITCTLVFFVLIFFLRRAHERIINNSNIWWKKIKQNYLLKMNNKFFKKKILFYQLLIPVSSQIIISINKQKNKNIKIKYFKILVFT